MDPYGRKLNYFQKNFLDIYGLIAISVLIVLFVLFVIVRSVVACFKLKTD